MSKKYTVELGEEICEQIACGKSFAAVCEKHKISPKVVRNWAESDADFRDKYHAAQSLHAQKSIEKIEQLGAEMEGIGNRKDLTRVKSAELQKDCITQVLQYLYPERYKSKSTELFISLPEYGEAKTPKERLAIISQAVCAKKISVDSAEKLAKIISIEMQISDFAEFAETITSKVNDLSLAVAKANGLQSIAGGLAQSQAKY